MLNKAYGASQGHDGKGVPGPACAKALKRERRSTLQNKRVNQHMKLVKTQSSEDKGQGKPGEKQSPAKEHGEPMWKQFVVISRAIVCSHL